MNRVIRLLALSVFFAGAAELEARTFALITGVGNYDDPRNNLDCLEADMANMRRLVTGPLGVAPADLVVLTDRQATAPGIIQAFRSHLVQKAGREDTVVFYYSGHGYHVPDLNGDEEDGQDEILAPYGVDILKEKSYITDDQLGELLKELRCARAIVILDSCHSGTGTRGMNDRIVKSWKPPFDELVPDKAGGFEYKPRPRDDSFRRLNAVASGPALETLVFTACRADQTALGPKPGSLFTAALTEQLVAKPQQEIGSLMAVVGPAVSSMAVRIGNGHKQVPQFEGPASARLVRTTSPVVANPTPPADATVSPVRPSPATPTAAAANAATPARPASAVSTVRDGEIIQHRDFGVLVQLINVKSGDNVASQGIKVGTEVTVEVRPERDCYIRLYHLDAAGKLTLVYPNTFQQINFVKANTTVQFPGKNDAFRFVIEEPTGMELIKAVCSSEPFKEQMLPPEGNSPFFRLPGLRSGELSSRGLGAYATRPVPAGAPATATPAPSRLQAENYVSYLVLK